MEARSTRLRRIRHLKRVALALAVTAIAAPAAQAHQIDEGGASSASAAAVLTEPDPLRPQVAVPVSSAAPASVVIRGDVKTGIPEVAVSPVAVGGADAVGIDWRDVAIGAAGVFALGLLGASALLGLRHGRAKSGLATT